jgi:organic radical activating enzyme
MKKIIHKRIEFYITNVCNFNCDNCNRLNNYYFSGHEKWNDYLDVYRIWSEKIDFDQIIILGGEPTLNPDLDSWIKGLVQLWPKSKISIRSNGSHLKYWADRGLFDLLAKTKVKLEIFLHNNHRRYKVMQEIESYLSNPVNNLTEKALESWAHAYDMVKDPRWPNCTNYREFELLPEYIKKECVEVHKIGFEDFLQSSGILDRGDIQITDSNNVSITIRPSDSFVTAPLKYAENNMFKVYNSNPDIAHSVCISKWCTHMMKGKIYKCHHVALLPEFSKQFNVEMSNTEKELLDQYIPLSVDSSVEDMDNFFNALPKVIPQCQLCPEKLDQIPLKSGTNKPKIKKIININPV